APRHLRMLVRVPKLRKTGQPQTTSSSGAIVCKAPAMSAALGTLPARIHDPVDGRDVPSKINSSILPCPERRQAGRRAGQLSGTREGRTSPSWAGDCAGSLSLSRSAALDRVSVQGVRTGSEAGARLFRFEDPSAR